MPRAAEPLPAAASSPAIIAPAFGAAFPVVPAEIGIAVPGDYNDLFRAPTNGTTDLQSRRFARQWYVQLAVGQSICFMGFKSNEVSWANPVGHLSIL